MEELKAYLLNVAGGCLLGVGIGHAASMYWPIQPIQPGDAKDNSPATLLAKQGLKVVARVAAEAYALGLATQYILPDPNGADPTNGAAALMLMFISDSGLCRDVRGLNEVMHAMMTRGEVLLTSSAKTDADIELLRANLVTAIKKSIDLTPPATEDAFDDAIDPPGPAVS